MQDKTGDSPVVSRGCDILLLPLSTATQQCKATHHQRVQLYLLAPSMQRGSPVQLSFQHCPHKVLLLPSLKLAFIFDKSHLCLTHKLQSSWFHLGSADPVPMWAHFSYAASLCFPSCPSKPLLCRVARRVF